MPPARYNVPTVKQITRSFAIVLSLTLALSSLPPSALAAGSTMALGKTGVPQPVVSVPVNLNPGGAFKDISTMPGDLVTAPQSVMTNVFVSPAIQPAPTPEQVPGEVITAKAETPGTRVHAAILPVGTKSLLGQFKAAILNLGSKKVNWDNAAQRPEFKAGEDSPLSVEVALPIADNASNPLKPSLPRRFFYGTWMARKITPWIVGKVVISQLISSLSSEPALAPHAQFFRDHAVSLSLRHALGFAITAAWKPNMVRFSRNDIGTWLCQLASQGIPLRQAAHILAYKLLPALAHELRHGITAEEWKRGLGFPLSVSPVETEVLSYADTIRVWRQLQERSPGSLVAMLKGLDDEYALLNSLWAQGWGAIERVVRKVYSKHPSIFDQDTNFLKQVTQAIAADTRLRGELDGLSSDEVAHLLESRGISQLLQALADPARWQEFRQTFIQIYEHQRHAVEPIPFSNKIAETKTPQNSSPVFTNSPIGSVIVAKFILKGLINIGLLYLSSRRLFQPAIFMIPSDLLSLGLSVYIFRYSWSGLVSFLFGISKLQDKFEKHIRGANSDYVELPLTDEDLKQKKQPIDMGALLGNQVVIVGERHMMDSAHYKAIVNALPELKKAGLTHIALEYSPGGAGLLGWLVSMVLVPMHLELFLLAKLYGIKILRVDEYNTTLEGRNHAMAENLAKVIRRDSHAKIIFIVGSAHIGGEDAGLEQSWIQNLLKEKGITALPILSMSANKPEWQIESEIARRIHNAGLEREPFYISTDMGPHGFKALLNIPEPSGLIWTPTPWATLKAWSKAFYYIWQKMWR